MKWRKLKDGHYVAERGGDRFEVIWMSRLNTGNGQDLWHARKNGKVFDAGRTMAEAKGYCESREPDGRPLIEIL